MFDPSPLPFLALMAAGFAIGAAGHLYGSRAAQAIGIGLILLATLLLPLALYAAD